MSKDPLPIGSVVGDLMRARGWSRRLDAARIHERWEDVVGSDVANHCRPGQLRDDGTLDILADSAAWATQLSFLRGALMDRLAKTCGPGLVTSVEIRTNQDTRRSR